MNPLFLVYCTAVRRLQGLSWPLPDCFVFVCLSLGSERREWDSKRWRKKSHSISWTDHWSGWLWHVMTQTASFLPLLSRRWPYKWSCRLLPYAIKRGVKQDGVLSCSYAQRHPDTLCSVPSPFGKEKQITAAVSSGMVLSTYPLFSLFLPCLCFIASCECWSEARSWSFPNRCLGAYRPRLCPYLWPSASCILSLACLRVGIYFT